MFTLCCSAPSPLVLHSAKMGSKPNLTEHERTVSDALHMAKLSISRIDRQLGRPCAKDFKKYGKNHGGKINSKISLQDFHNITIHGN